MKTNTDRGRQECLNFVRDHIGSIAQHEKVAKGEYGLHEVNALSLSVARHLYNHINGEFLLRISNDITSVTQNAQLKGKQCGKCGMKIRKPSTV